MSRLSTSLASASMASPSSNSLPWRLDHALSRAALAQPDATAIELQGFSISYAVLEYQSNRIAKKLLAEGYGKGHFIAVVARNIAEFAVGCLAVMKSGAAYISLDLRYSHSRIENVLEHQTASLVLSSHWFPDALAPEGMPVWHEFDSWMMIGESIPMPNILHKENTPASLCYTSGTTGVPKGAIITHAGIEGLVFDPVFEPYSKADRVAQMTTYGFDAATMEVWGSLVHGACIVEVPKSLMTIPHKFDVFLRENRISSIWLTTSHFNAIVSRRPDVFEKLKSVFFGGEVASIAVLESVFESNGAPTRLINCYGPTEATCITSWHPVSSTDVKNGIIPIGKPLQGRQLSVRDETLWPVQEGTEGELVISGLALASGYIADERQTNEKFVPDPLAPDEKLYRTGDRAKQDAQGSFYCLGRDDDQIKVRGLRVEISAVIKALVSLDDVALAAVLSRTSEFETQEMIAFVQLDKRAGKYVTAETVRAKMASSVPDYMVPSQLYIVDYFPTTDSGKLDRKALLEGLWTPDRASESKAGDHSQISPSEPLSNTSLSEKGSASPETQLEVSIARIWEKVLVRSCDDRTHDFYDLGGDSLKLIQVIEDIEVEFGYGLNAKDLYSPLTISGLADRINKNTAITEFSKNGAFLIWMRWWLLPVPETILHSLGKTTPAEILDIPVSISDVSRTQSFEHMVDYLEKRLIDVCPEGPYRLAGYSYTGLLAYELVQRLSARGKKVELLVLLDSYCGKPLFHRRIIRLFKNGIGQWLWQRCKNISNKWVEKSTLDTMKPKRPEAQYYYSTLASARDYQTKKYDGKTLVIETTDTKAFVMPRWNKRLTGDFHVVTVEGDHESIMKRPHQTKQVCAALNKV